PSRKLKFEWQCSSAYGTEPLRRCTWDSNGWRLRDHAGLSPPFAEGGTFEGRPATRRSESRRSISDQGITGLLNATRRVYRTCVRPTRVSGAAGSPSSDRSRVRVVSRPPPPSRDGS